MVSVINYFRDRAGLTVACLASLDGDPGYPLHEVVMGDDRSTEAATCSLRQRLESRLAL